VTAPVERLYRKKPIVIEACQLTVADAYSVAGWAAQAEVVSSGDVPIGLNIRTLEGTMWAEIGDWIIRGVKGEFYPCKPDVFAATYEPVTLAASAGPPMDSPTERLAALLRQAQQETNPNMLSPYYGHHVADWLLAHGVTLAASAGPSGPSPEPSDETIRMIAEVISRTDHDPAIPINEVWLAAKFTLRAAYRVDAVRSGAVRVGNLGSVNLRDGQPYRYCPECGTEESVRSGRLPSEGPWRELAEYVVDWDGATEDGCALCGGEYIGETVYIAHDRKCVIPVVRLQMIECLMEGDPAVDSPVGKRLLALTSAQEAYERVAAARAAPGDTT